MRSFEIPDFYKSPIISRVKHARKVLDPRKQDFSPSVLDFGAVKFVLARHFGFCYGVENAIEIAYKAIDENPGKRIFLLSQMIHNPEVNSDLKSRGVDFLMDTEGNVLTPITELKSDDVVLIPAFGTTVEMEAHLEQLGVDVARYNTTCPFVEKVWKRSPWTSELGRITDRQHKLLVEFGLTPSTRSKLVVLKGGESESPFDKWIERGGLN